MDKKSRKYAKRNEPTVTPTPIVKRFKTIEERRLNEKVEALIPESKVYTQLLEFEKKIDAAIAKRKLDVQEALRVKPNKTPSTLRIIIHNTRSNQQPFYHTDSAFEATLLEQPSWTLFIEGHLLEDPSSYTTRSVTSTSGSTQKRKFTSFFSKIFVQLPKEDFPDNDIIEWHKTDKSYDSNGFEIKRSGSKEVKAKILLYIDHQPPMYKISQPLASLINMQTETRSRVIMGLWQYIKINRLQDPQDKKSINLNPAMKAIFDFDKIQFSQIPELLVPHLSPIDPIQVDYNIRLFQDPTPLTLDVQIQVDEPTTLNQHLEPFTKQIQQLDDQITEMVEKIHQHKRKRDFMTAFSRAPVQFINDLINSQIRDKKVIQTDHPSNEPERHSDFFYQPYVFDAVQQLLESVVTPQYR